MERAGRLKEPARKRRRISQSPPPQQIEDEDQHKVNEQDDTVIPDSDGEETEELPLLTENAPPAVPQVVDDAEPLALEEGDTSLPAEEPDEYDAVYDELEWDGLLAMDEEATVEHIFSPGQSRRTSNTQAPVSSPLKPDNAAARASPSASRGQQDETDEMTVNEETNNSLANEQAQPVDDVDEEEEALIRANEAATLAKYQNLAFLNNFHNKHDQFEAFSSPAPNSATSTGFTSGFSSVRGKTLVVSEEALAKARRFAQLSPEAAVPGQEAGAEGQTSTLATTETPLHQKTRPGTSLLASAAAASREGSAPPTVSRMQKPSGSGNPLQPLRFGPKKGHTLLPNRLPQVPLNNAQSTVEEAISAPAPVASTSATAMSSFTSGSGRAVSMPTAQEAEEHMSSLEGRSETGMEKNHAISHEASSPPSYPGLSMAGGSSFKMPSRAAIDQESVKMRAMAMDVDDNEASRQVETSNSASGFTSGAGKAVNMPTKKAVAAVAASLDAGSTRDTLPENNKMVSVVINGGFTTGGGKAVALPTEEQIRAITSRLDGTSNAEQLVLPVSPTALAETSALAGLVSGSGKTVQAPSAAAIAASSARLTEPSEKKAVSPQRDPETPVRQALSIKSTNGKTAARLNETGAKKQQAFRSPSAAVGPSRPFKPPAVARAVSANLPATPNRLPSSPAVIPSSQHRRLNMQMTPRNTATSALNRGTFKTPFKNGVRPDPQTLETLKKETNQLTINPGTSVDVVSSHSTAGAPKTSAKSNDKGKHRLVKDSVFDIYTKKERIGMVEYGLQPGSHVDYLITSRLPPAVIFMTFQKAEHFRFLDEFGYEAAYEDLVHYNPCHNASLEWVKNHWTLIVWKLAAMVRAKPDELHNWWSFVHVVDQLKYRYEREIVCGQRSCIRRIQERDSSPWLPMILVVAEVIYEERELPPEPGSDEERQGIVTTEMVPAAMVLSDGWYKIRTSSLDDSLYRAICFRNIYPGLKIRLQGAKLDGSGEGAEPLEAFASSTIVVSGNGCSRAVWDAKLGFQKQPYICTFRSLLPDGGLVPFVDIVITRIYPVGYKGPYVEGESQEIWNEQEEKEHRREWEAAREKAIADIRMEQQRAFGRLRGLQSLVTGALRSRSTKSEIKEEALGMDDFSEVFDKLEEEPDKASLVIRRQSKEVLEDLASFIDRKVEGYALDGGQGLEKELEARCPTRAAKPFRIVRARDYRVSVAEANRDCQLSINDVDKLGDDFLVVGRRYLLSNVVPGRTTSWSAPKCISGEIFLTTRYDSRWQMLQP